MATRKRARLVVEGPTAFVSIGGGAGGVVGIWIEAATAVRGGRAVDVFSALDGPVRVTIVIEPREVPAEVSGEEAVQAEAAQA